MIRLAHLSDPHIGPLPATSFRQLLSKRVLGYVNWHRNRAGKRQAEILAALVADIHAATPAHVAVTGDLVNLALPSELEPARAFLEALGDGRDVTVVPGNHDAYVPGALGRAVKAWAPWLAGDDDGETPHFPTVRRRSELGIIGVSTARATAPFMATGVVDDDQATALADKLESLGREGLCRVVLIHHPPIRGITSWHRRLVGISRVTDALRRSGAELVLHGHTHLPSLHHVAGPKGTIPVVGVPAAGAEPGGHKPPSGYNLFELIREKGGWSIAQITRDLDPASGRFIETGRRGL